MKIYCYKDKIKKKDDDTCELSYYRRTMMENAAKRRARYGGYSGGYIGGGYSSSYRSSSIGDPDYWKKDDAEIEAETGHSVGGYASFDEFREMIRNYGNDEDEEMQEISEKDETEDVTEWIQNMTYIELITKFPGGIEEALEFSKKEKENAEPKVHYNSPEPEKFGAKAFTKNAEIYIAPGEEDSLEHELGHVYQQKTQNIPATDEINGEKVNADPKIEEEADEIAKNIDVYMPEIFPGETSKTNDMVQFAPLNDDELREMIKTEARDMEIPQHLITEKVENIIMTKFKEYESSYIMHGDWFLRPPDWSKNYNQTCIIEALKLVEIIVDRAKSKRVIDLLLPRDIVAILNKLDEKSFFTFDTTVIDLELENVYPEKRKLFASDFLERGERRENFSLEEALKANVLTGNQYQQINEYISILNECCANKGVVAVLEGVNTNVISQRVMLSNMPPFNHPQHFVSRLKLMTEYIESVYEKFQKKYWIESTGSDPHKNGEHALFLIDKETKERFVYKPHDMTADDALIGETTPSLFGIFAEINKLIKNVNLGRFLSDEQQVEFLKGDALATMKIDTKAHLEEFITPKKEMRLTEAEIYFFRAGILEAIASSMGVTDLHHDNIMPTENGPLIIDAEVNFIHYGKATGLIEQYGALLDDTDSNGNAVNSTFAIMGTGKSGEAFKSEDSQCKVMYEKGYEFMVEQMSENTEVYAKIFQDKISNVKQARILPVATAKFSEILQDALRVPQSRGEFANDLKNLVVEGLERYFLDNQKIKVTLFNSYAKKEGPSTKLEAAILRTFADGTIPALYTDMQGNIWLDSTKVGAILLKTDSTDKKT